MVARGVKRLKTDTHPFVKIPPSWDYPFFLDFPTRCANEPFSISCNGFPFSDHHFGPNLSIGPKTEGVFMGRGLKKGSNSRTHTPTHTCDELASERIHFPVHYSTDVCFNFFLMERLWYSIIRQKSKQRESEKCSPLHQNIQK